MVIVSENVDSLGKGENACYQHFILSPKLLLNAYFLGSSESVLCVIELSLYQVTKF